MADQLRNDADRIESPHSVSEQAFERIDGCVNACGRGGDDPRLTMAVAFLDWLDEGAATPHIQRGFAYEYPEYASNLVRDDWTSAIAAHQTIGRLGKAAASWVRLAAILTKAGCAIDRESLRKLGRLRAADDVLRRVRSAHLERQILRGLPDEAGFPGDHERLRRHGRARRARMVEAVLRDDADRLNREGADVGPEVFERIDGCQSAYAGGGRSAALNAAVRFMFYVDEGVSLETRSLYGRARGAPGAFNAAAEAQRGFASEYPNLAAMLTEDDWLAAIKARGLIGKRGKAAPWEKLAKVFSGTGHKIDGENLKKACTGIRNTPGRVLGTMRWGSRKR